MAGPFGGIKVLQFIQGFNLLIFALFTVFYAYQLFYVVAALWHDRKRTPMPEARNSTSLRPSSPHAMSGQ